MAFKCINSKYLRCLTTKTHQVLWASEQVKAKSFISAELEINFYLPAIQPSKNPALLLTSRGNMYVAENSTVEGVWLQRVRIMWMVWHVFWGYRI